MCIYTNTYVQQTENAINNIELLYLLKGMLQYYNSCTILNTLYYYLL